MGLTIGFLVFFLAIKKSPLFDILGN